MTFPTKLQTGLQFLTKDLLRFCVASDQLPRIDTRRTHPTGARGSWGWAAGEKARRTQESAPVKLLAAWAAPAGKAQNAGATKSALLWNTRKLEPRAAQGRLPIEQCSRGEHTPVSGANPVWPEHCECSPHTPVTFVCSAPPSPQHGGTSDPEQETTSARLCQGGS